MKVWRLEVVLLDSWHEACSVTGNIRIKAGLVPSSEANTCSCLTLTWDDFHFLAEIFCP